MVGGTLKSDKLLIVYDKHFLHFEWTLEESDVRKGVKLQSSAFDMGEDECSYLEFIMSAPNGMPYLYLYNANSLENGRFVLTMCNKDNSSIITLHRKIDSTIICRKIDFFTPRSWPSSVQYPIILFVTARSSSSAFSDELSIQEKRLSELCTDLKTCFDLGTNTDIVLKIDEDIIKAHKVVLEARSPVFRRMFSNDLSEASLKTVTISDIKPEIMKKLVNFLYSSEMGECSFDDLLELYYAADKYEVLSLRDDCRTELLINVDVDNACLLFSLANRHNDGSFKKKLIKFISVYFKSAIKEDTLKEMDKEDIIELVSLCALKII